MRCNKGITTHFKSYKGKGEKQGGDEYDEHDALTGMDEDDDQEEVQDGRRKEADSGKQAMVATTNGYATLCSDIASREKFE